MKKVSVIALAVFALSLLPGSFAAAEDTFDFQSMKKAVKKNPNYDTGQEVKWFKVLITDDETKKDKVRITLPLALLEIFVKATENKHLRVNREEYDIDLREIFKELKKLGPMALIEVYEDGETIKIWLE